MPRPKPTIIGLYGLPGCGKTHLLAHLADTLPSPQFGTYESSFFLGVATALRNLAVSENTLIGPDVLPQVDEIAGHLAEFRLQPPRVKQSIRERAMQHMQHIIGKDNRVGLVAGHYSFWENEDGEQEVAWTETDAQAYTHIVYLKLPAETIALRRATDRTRRRRGLTFQHLEKWQSAEIEALRKICRDEKIVFSVVSGGGEHAMGLMPDYIKRLDILSGQHGEETNTAVNLSLLRRIVDDENIKANPSRLITAVVFDADRTLAPQDTGRIFWQIYAAKYQQKTELFDPLGDLFSGPHGYSYQAWMTAMQMYATLPVNVFEDVCKRTAEMVTPYPELRKLMSKTENDKQILPIIITTGIQKVWQNVFPRARIIGMEPGRNVVTAEVKAKIVRELKENHDLTVWAFGDSPLDIPMMREAHHAIVVVGDEDTRSSTMNAALEQALDEGLVARQMLLPTLPSVPGPLVILAPSPRLTITRLPTITVDDEWIRENLFVAPSAPEPVLQQQVAERGERPYPSNIHVLDPLSGRILATPMRNATVSGPALRAAHQTLGQLLALTFLPSIIGLEEVSIRHVQGGTTTGHRILHEADTLIVALMRGGEPMALGVSDAMPTAGFVHAFSPSDLTRGYFWNTGTMRTVVLVDSVINSGKTVMEFVSHIRKQTNERGMDPFTIVVVAGVVQAGCLADGGALVDLEGVMKEVEVVCGRVSENKYKGCGETDTGNRLFGTMWIE